VSNDQILLIDYCKQFIFCIVLARIVINKDMRLMGSYAVTLDEQFTAFQRVLVPSSSGSGGPKTDRV
jgi:hypothetical protein